MKKLLEDAREIINNIVAVKNMRIVEMFNCGNRKIEFMIEDNDNIISISFVDDFSYDFTIFDSSGGYIVYNNTFFLDSLDQLAVVLKKDLIFINKDQ